LDYRPSYWASLFNSIVIFFALQDTVSVHRPGFYAERFQRFMCNTVFKKIPCKWLLSDDPLLAPLPQEMGGRTPLSGYCKGQRPLLLYQHPVRAASHPYVIHSVCPSGFQVSTFPLALPSCIVEVRGHFWGTSLIENKYTHTHTYFCGCKIHTTGTVTSVIFYPCPTCQGVLRLVQVIEVLLISA
jgi:hypothetical protein